MINLKSINKNIRAYLAQIFYSSMSKKYDDDIRRSIDLSIVYTRDSESHDAVQDIIDDKKKFASTNLYLVPTDSVSCLFKYVDVYKDDVAVLNFASFKHPGGMFLNGSSAQEESLCHQSTLYPILLAFIDNYYAPNLKVLNRGLYQDQAIYSKDVIFFDHTLSHTKNNDGTDKYAYTLNHTTRADVITCAAPNAKAFLRRKYGLRWDEYTTDLEITVAMRDRILTVLDTAVIGGKNNLVLGAFGCGVFGNNPETVADYFYEYLTDEYAGCFENVYFAVPKYGGSGYTEPNYKAFRDAREPYGVVCLEE